MKKYLIPVLLFLFIPVSLFAIACSSDDETVPVTDAPTAAAGSTGSGDSAARAEVEQTVRAAVTAYTNQDLTRFLTYWTDDGLQAEFDATREEITMAGAEFFGGPPLTLRNFLKTDVSGNEATSDFELVFGIAVSPQRYDLVRENNAWKIDSTEELQAAVPSGTTAVDLDLDEFSFKFDAARVASGNIAFRVDNVGEQPHEAVLIKVPATFTLDQLLQAADQDIPEGVEAVGFAGPFEPGAEGTMIFTERLAAGKYMMVCFLPDEADPQGAPHLLKGMAVEFNVTGQGGGN